MLDGPSIDFSPNISYSDFQKFNFFRMKVRFEKSVFWKTLDDLR